MSILFESIEINGLEIPNRFVRSATNDRRAGFSGEVTDDLIDVYETLSAGDVGLIITGHAFVSWNGKASPRMLGVHSNKLIPGLKKLVNAVHKYDSKIFLQINHAGRQTASATIGETPIAPSPVYFPKTDETPRALDEDEIESLIGCYGAAAKRAVAAGFDGVQIHCAHGYLGSQFISPYTNRREDKWGGSLENRMRFLLEAYRAVRNTVGDAYPVIVKLNSEDYLDGGLTIDDGARIAQALSDAGIDAIEISGGMGESSDKIIKPDILEEDDEAYFLSNARRFKQVIDVPLILVGGLRSPGLIERLLESGQAEMASLCRPFIREPDLVKRWKQGDREKAECISCSGCQKYRDEPTSCILLE